MASKENTKTLAQSVRRQVSKYRYNDSDFKSGIAYWGDNNDLPNQYLKLIDDPESGSSFHGAAIEGIVQYVKGDGIALSEEDIELPVANSDGDTWNDILERISYDYKVYGGYALEIIWAPWWRLDLSAPTVDEDGNPIDATAIQEVYHIPFKDIRAKEKGYRESLEGWYLSNKWKKSNSNIRKKIDLKKDAIYLPVFDPKRAKQSFTDDFNDALIASGQLEKHELREALIDPEEKQILVCKRYNPASEIYPEPDYKPGLKDIVKDALATQGKISFLNRGIVNSLWLNFVGEYTDEEKGIIESRISDGVSGAVNAGEFFTTYSNTAAEAPTVINSNAKSQAETYTAYDDDSESKIFLAHGIKFPELFKNVESSGFARQQVEEKATIFLNTTIRDIQMPILNGLNSLIEFILLENEGRESNDLIKFEINPINLFAGLDNEDVDNITDEEEDTNEANNNINEETDGGNTTDITDTTEE